MSVLIDKQLSLERLVQFPLSMYGMLPLKRRSDNSTFKQAHVVLLLAVSLHVVAMLPLPISTTTIELAFITSRDRRTCSQLMDLPIEFLMLLGPSVLMICASPQSLPSKLSSGTQPMLPRDLSSQVLWEDRMPPLFSLASVSTRRDGAIQAVRMVRSKFGLTRAKLSNASKLTLQALLESKQLKASLFQAVKTREFASCLPQVATLSLKSSLTSLPPSLGRSISLMATFL